MKQGNAIEVRNLKKKFKVFYDKGYSLKERILFKKRNRYEERWVLKGISFDVKKGEAVGLIGHNGCGKSTTLKLLNRIIYPDSGTIEMNGRVSSLIELGAGFHPDMSGRENIYINASIFGLTRKEIDERVDDIIAFSELEDYMDNPVRTYSSGMYMRLAFAVAINVDADILLIDEILAVGDANFQNKCFNKLREIKGNGVTIVIVSHSLGQIEQICDRSIWLNKGEIQLEEAPHLVHPVYMEFMGSESRNLSYSGSVQHKGSEKVSDDLNNIGDELGDKKIEIKKVELLDNFGNYVSKIKTGDSISLVVYYQRNDSNILQSEFGFNIFRNDGVDCYGTNTLIDKVKKIQLKDSGKIKVELQEVFLLQGKYRIDIAFHDEFGKTYHHIYSAVKFEIYNLFDEVGISRIRHSWEVDDILI